MLLHTPSPKLVRFSPIYCVFMLLVWMMSLAAHAAMPTVTSISPALGPTAGGQSVTIRGSGFTDATSVTIGGTACTTTFGSVTSDDNYIFCTTGAHAAGGPFSVQVTTPSGTNAANTLYTYANVAPTVTSISPAIGPTAGGQSVTIRGSGFTGATSVTIGGTACTTTFGSVTSDDNYIFCTTGPHTAGGPFSVDVTTPSGTNVPNTLYTYDGPTLPPSAPAVTAISPISGPASGGQLVTITGSGFTGVTGVSIGGAACAPFMVVSDSSITCTTGVHAAGGPFSVEVTTPAGTNAANALYTYRTESGGIESIPTLSEWGLLALMALISLVVVRRRRF